MNKQNTAACAAVQEQRREPNDQSAATSRENAERPINEAATSGELAAASLFCLDSASTEQFIKLGQITRELDLVCQNELIDRGTRRVAAQAAYDLAETLPAKFQVELSEKCVNPLNWIYQ